MYTGDESNQYKEFVNVVPLEGNKCLIAAIYFTDK